MDLKISTLYLPFTVYIKWKNNTLLGSGGGGVCMRVKKNLLDLSGEFTCKLTTCIYNCNETYKQIPCGKL